MQTRQLLQDQTGLESSPKKRFAMWATAHPSEPTIKSSTFSSWLVSSLTKPSTTAKTYDPTRKMPLSRTHEKGLDSPATLTPV